jgi:hypothetical protein
MSPQTGEKFSILKKENAVLGLSVFYCLYIPKGYAGLSTNWRKIFNP